MFSVMHLILVICVLVMVIIFFVVFYSIFGNGNLLNTKRQMVSSVT